MAARLEVSVNGERICVSGFDGLGGLSVDVNYIRRSGKSDSHFLHISALADFLKAGGALQIASWPSPTLEVGDEITIRILGPGDFDPPDDVIKND
jgi:hypothetical protein